MHAQIDKQRPHLHRLDLDVGASEGGLARVCARAHTQSASRSLCAQYCAAPVAHAARAVRWRYSRGEDAAQKSGVRDVA